MNAGEKCKIYSNLQENNTEIVFSRQQHQQTQLLFIMNFYFGRGLSNDPVRNRQETERRSKKSRLPIRLLITTQFQLFINEIEYWNDSNNNSRIIYLFSCATENMRIPSKHVPAQCIQKNKKINKLFECDVATNEWLTEFRNIFIKSSAKKKN